MGTVMPPSTGQGTGAVVPVGGYGSTVRGSVGVRILSACAAVVAVLFLGSLSSSAYAVDCIGPDDPPGCVTPAPTPTVTVTETAPAAAPAAALLDASQFDVLLWLGGGLLAVTIVGVVGSWSR